MPMLPLFHALFLQSAAQAPAQVMAPAAAYAPAQTPAAIQQVESHGYTYQVQGNTLLATADVRAALQSADSPREALTALRRAFIAKGHFLVAIVARVEDRQVLLHVVQGRLTRVEGPTALARFFEGLKNDEQVLSSDVIRQGILAQAYASTNGMQPQVSFKPAPEAGGSTMVIGQTAQPDASPLGGSFTVGNFGNRYAGHQVAQAQGYVRHAGVTLQASYSRALTGLDQDTRGAYYAAAGATLSWVSPWGTYQLDDQYTKYELGDAFAPLYPIGHIHAWGVSGTQFLYADDTSRWTLSEGVHAVRTRDTVFKYAYTLRDQSYLVANLGTDVSWRFGGLFGRPASLALGGQVKLGGARARNGFDRGTGNPTPHFRAYSANASFTQAIAGGWVGTFALSGQASTDILPSHEQWVLGGLNNMAAYLPGTLVGDRGYLARLSVTAPQWSFGALRMQPSVFGEQAAVRYSYIAPRAPTWQALSDAGVSLNLDLPAAGVSSQLTYAWPLDSREVPRKLRAGQRAHLFFYLQAAF
ncbi:ShlB/FhaC/HecB family hemolysin secretion/activation protein [Frateuria sp. GZRR33]|uniref:ShlB/FhaC/HecB family hemolysin secretion/activation protein n=1 Tax=Frateuria sp. GZRR33 TaxID=3351535 RepID=UPI003EDC0E56